MCSIIGVGERLHKVLGQIDLGTLDSGERSLPFGLLVYLILLKRPHLTLAHWTQVSDRCPLGYLFVCFKEYLVNIKNAESS